MTEISLRSVTEADRKLLFDWANDREVRKNSFSTQEITWEEHCAWFARIMSDENVLQYVMEEEGKAAGQIRFAIKDDTAEISYSIAGEYRGRGLAKRMVKLGMEKAVSERPKITEFTARVKPENVISSKVFCTLGFDENERGTFTYYPGR
ncbi:MAG: GNAT family N-acetyltransferase [Lachnospiraceae bacterium]|nr:GNAT family N-acetyltransferase [Lachnospiraceae bacterium]